MGTPMRPAPIQAMRVVVAIVFPLCPQIVKLDQFAVAQFLKVAPLEGDFSVNDDISAIGNAACFVEILFRNQHGEAETALEFGDDINRLRDQQWRQTIVLYDNVPGGAGHVKRIKDEMAQVIASALKIVECDCEKSCYRCRSSCTRWNV